MEGRLGGFVKLVWQRGLKWYYPVNRWYYYEKQSRKALEKVYTRSLYHLSINYREEPPPPLEQKWMRKLLEANVEYSMA